MTVLIINNYEKMIKISKLIIIFILLIKFVFILNAADPQKSDLEKIAEPYLRLKTFIDFGYSLPAENYKFYKGELKKIRDAAQQSFNNAQKLVLKLSQKNQDELKIIMEDQTKLYKAASDNQATINQMVKENNATIVLKEISSLENQIKRSYNTWFANYSVL